MFGQPSFQSQLKFLRKDVEDIPTDTITLLQKWLQAETINALRTQADLLKVEDRGPLDGETEEQFQEMLRLVRLGQQKMKLLTEAVAGTIATLSIEKITNEPKQTANPTT